MYSAYTQAKDFLFFFNLMTSTVSKTHNMKTEITNKKLEI